MLPIKEIVIVPHGETQLNAARVPQPPDSPLNESGRLQAKAVAQRLAEMDIGAILSGDLVRALETVRAIATALALLCAQRSLVVVSQGLIAS
jgi:probable phosphoglycerate mutase